MAEPISLVEAKAHLRVVGDSEDDDIGSAITEARAAIEDVTGLVLVPRTVVETFTRFDRIVQLRAWPVTSITSVAYLDSTGSSSTLAGSGYRLATGKRPARIAPVGCWPRTLDDRYSGAPDAVSITFEAGYGAGTVPPPVLRALKLLLGHFYEHREAVQAGDRAAALELPLGVEMLLRRYKVRAL